MRDVKLFRIERGDDIETILNTGLVLGSGDMLKIIYDTNNNGVVDNSEKLNNQSASYFLDTDNHTDGVINKVFTGTEKTKLANISGTNTGNETTTTIGGLINGATEKTTPADADMVGLVDSIGGNILKKLSWLNIKATLKTYFDTLYATIGGGGRRLMFPIAGSIGATGTNVTNTWIVDGTYTISKCNLWYGTAGNGTLTVDINKNGTTLFATTKPSITTTSQYSINSGTLTTTTLASGDILTVDIDAVPATTGTDLYIELVLT